LRDMPNLMSRSTSMQANKMESAFNKKRGKWRG
jgi:hypothetical protein